MPVNLPHPQPMHDDDAWKRAEPQDRYIYDRLLLGSLVGHVCGPAGVPVPKPGTYMVKPITNILGMGVGAETRHLENSTDDLPAGHFWMEMFYGEHLSIDVYDGKVACVYQGISDGPGRFLAWIRRPLINIHDVPNFLWELSVKYGAVNYETIGGRIIEAHLRPNPDHLKHDARVLVPIWRGQSTDIPGFVPDADGGRLGFVVIKT